MLNEVGGDVTFTTDGGQDFTVPAAVDVPDGVPDVRAQA